jgi:hypothetical protein
VIVEGADRVGQGRRIQRMGINVGLKLYGS